MSGTPGKFTPKVAVRLQTNDGNIHTAEPSQVAQMGTVCDMLKLECTDSNEVIPLTKIGSWTMTLVLKWCEVVQKNEDGDKNAIFRELIHHAQGGDELVYDILMAANYLNVESLLQAGCQYLADIIKSCTSSEQIRHRFKLYNDLPPDNDDAMES
ncbi:hypothetical protein KR018_006945 [Drosophila ironensis]|nr:hypothetical protein KR018_006945 [Drosophila ironensis]